MRISVKKENSIQSFIEYHFIQFASKITKSFRPDYLFLQIIH